MRGRMREVVVVLISILFTISFFVGKVFDQQYQLAKDRFLFIKIIMVFVLTCIIIYILYMCFDKKFIQKTTKKGRISQKIFDSKNTKITWLIVMLCWLPNYILYLPGIFTVDGINQINQLATGQLTNHHPILTTLIEAPWILIAKQFGHMEVGLLLYLFLTLLFTSYVVYRGFYWMSKHNISYLTRYVMLIYFIVYPIWSAYARTFVKDTLFYPIFYLYVLFVFDILIDTEKFCDSNKKNIEFILISILLCLVRHNGFYVSIVTVIGILIFCKENRKRFIFVMIGILVFWKIYNAILPLANITPGGKQEMLSIPFQQTARYIKEHKEQVTSEEKEAINAVLNYNIIAQNYDPNLSDPVKGTYTGRDECLSEYFKVWWKQFCKAPDTYVSATLNGTYGYYAYKDKIKCACGYYNQPEYFEKYNQYYKIHWGDRLTKIKEFYYKHVIIDGFQNTPMKLLTQPMIYNWLMIILLGYFLQDNRLRKYWVVFWPIIISFMICIASPVNGDLRYMLPIMSTTILYFAFAEKIKSYVIEERKE